MKTNELDAKHLWKQLEDVLAPRLRLTPIERVTYSHLLPHSLLEGKRRLHFSVIWLARNLGLSRTPVRNAVHRLDELRALRLLERSKVGHVVEMRLPEEIRAAHAPSDGTNHTARLPPALNVENLEEIDFTKTWSLRRVIHERDGRRCFYCLRQTPARMLCLDHVVPRARSGRNSYRNLVSCCMECNSATGDRPGPDFLRSLYRQGRLTAKDFSGRLRALKDLAAGMLKPKFQTNGAGKEELNSSRSLAGKEGADCR